MSNQSFRALLVEDDQFKEAALLEFLETDFADIKVHVRRSFTSAKEFIKSEDLDFIFLDMSLPTFDISVNESGGRPNGFGGWDLMRYLDAKKIKSNVIVVTQFETFELNDQNLTIDTLKVIFIKKFGTIFKGIVKYDSTSNQWKPELRKLIDNAIQ